MLLGRTALAWLRTAGVRPLQRERLAPIFQLLALNPNLSAAATSPVATTPLCVILHTPPRPGLRPSRSLQGVVCLSVLPLWSPTLAALARTTPRVRVQSQHPTCLLVFRRYLVPSKLKSLQLCADRASKIVRRRRVWTIGRAGIDSGRT